MKRIPRPRALTGAFRFVAAALAVLWGLPLFVFWGYASATTSTASNASMPSAALAVVRVKTDAATADQEHRKLCSCASCPGGSHCCCSSAGSPQESFVIRAVCDSDTPLAVSITPGKIAFLATTGSASTAAMVLVQSTYATSNHTAPSHSPAPFLLPPRLS